MGDVCPAVTFRFSSFQLDLRVGELRRNGINVRLPDQSIQVLATLLEHAGDVVTRDELQRKLWPNGTVVEFEAGINAAIKRIRQALRDSAERPRYIETLPRKGYRFLAPVEREAFSKRVPSSEPVSDADPRDGQTVSHYKILKKLGQGAMGVVYQAEDTRLERPVALKFLSEELAQDHQALERFLREACAVSVLNHPNICTLYDIGETEGRRFLVMEYLEGHTLAELIAAKPLQVDQLLDLGIQIADALDAAQAKGIIHRDVKPANIFITTHGKVKMMDFGIAKLAKNAVARNAAAIGSREATVDISEQRVTNPDTPLGTVAYMSPEQVRSEKLDTRSDVFSFGVVLYEVATGRRPFQGTTTAELFQGILTETPVSPQQLRSELPADIEPIIQKALEKQPDLRYQHAADIRVDLGRVKRETGSGRAAVPVNERRPSPVVANRRFKWRWMIAASAIAVIAVGLGITGSYWFRRSRPATRQVLTALPLTAYFGHQTYPTFSPDGSQVAFSWNGEKEGNSNIFVKVIGSEPPFRLTNSAADEFSPAWSPDGRWIAFCRRLPNGKYAVILTSPIPGPERQLTELIATKATSVVDLFLPGLPIRAGWPLRAQRGRE